MAFWGVEVKPGKPHSHQFHNTQTRRLHVSQATLGVGNSTTKSLVQCNVGDKSPVLLCCLIPQKSESCHLALEFEEEEDDVIFSVLGPTSVHLTGFYLDKSSSNVNNGDDTDSYGEDIGATESEAYDNDEDEYEDDFIDDGDIEFVPDSPSTKGRAVIEEILDDEKPAKVNGNRKRLKKKYQVSDSDADAQNDIAKKGTRIFTVDSDDDDDGGLPLSTVIKTKYQESDSVNDQKQSIVKGGTGSFNLDNENEEHIPPFFVLNTKDGSIQDESDKKKLIESKKNEAEGGSNQVPGSEKKIEDMEACEIERGIEQPTNAPLLSLEIGHETNEAPKKKKRKRTKDGQTGGVNVVDVRKKDKVEPISNLSNDMGAGCLGHESVEKRKKKKKRANESRHGGVENDSKFDVQEEENFKVDARIDDTSKTEPVKDQAIDNLSNDKAVVQSSNENDVKTKKDKKRAEERQTREVADDSMNDVYKEETIQIKEAVSNELDQEVPVKDNSNDKGAGCVRHESEEKPKKKKKKRVKESRNDGVENDNKVDVQVDQNYEVEARIDEVSKNEPVKDQADDNLSSDKAVVHSSHESDMKTKKANKRAKDRQTSEVRDDSIIGAYKEEKFQVQEAGSKDINQEVAVKDNAIYNISIDNSGDVQDGQQSDGKVKKKKNKQAKERQANEAVDQDMINAQIDRIIEVEEARINEISLVEPFNIETYDNISNDKGVVKPEVGNGSHEKPMKKKKRAKEVPTGEIDVNITLIVEANTNDIALEEPLKDEGIGNQSNEKCFVQQNDSSLLPLMVGHDNKVKQKKKKKKRAKEGQSGGVGGDSLLVVHKEVQSGNFEAKTDVTMEERITEEFDKQTNDMIVTIGANYVSDEELTEKEKNETPNDGGDTNMTPESGGDANAGNAKK